MISIAKMEKGENDWKYEAKMMEIRESNKKLIERKKELGT